MKILLPHDVFDAQADLLEYLPTLMPLAQAEITLLYVLEDSMVKADFLKQSDSSLDLREKLTNKAWELLATAADRLKGKCLAVNTRILNGSPATMIESTAKQERFDLLVLGASRSEGLFLGGTATKVVKHVLIDTLIWRPPVKAEPYSKRALIAIDGSDESKRALKRFVEKFRPDISHTEIYLLNVVSIVGVWKFIAPVEFVASIEDNLNMAAETILADGEKILSEVKVAPERMIIRSGDIASEIIKVAKEINADVIVIGAKGVGAVEHFLLGSVSEKLSHGAPCSTVIFR